MPWTSPSQTWFSIGVRARQSLMQAAVQSSGGCQASMFHHPVTSDPDVITTERRSTPAQDGPQNHYTYRGSRARRHPPIMCAGRCERGASYRMLTFSEVSTPPDSEWCLVVPRLPPECALEYTPELHTVAACDSVMLRNSLASKACVTARHACKTAVFSQSAAGAV